MVCTLGRHLSELSIPCLFTNVLECLPQTRDMAGGNTWPPPMQRWWLQGDQASW